MLSSNVQSMDFMAWLLWMMRPLNGCSTPVLRSAVAKQWIATLTTRSNNDEVDKNEVKQDEFLADFASKLETIAN